MQIEPIEEERAPAAVRRIYRGLEERGTPVSNLIKILAHEPAVLGAHTQLSGAIWAEGSLQSSRSLPTCGFPSSTAAPIEPEPTPLRASSED